MIDPKDLRHVARAICRAWFYCDLDTPDGKAYWLKNEQQCMVQAEAAIKAVEELKR